MKKWFFILGLVFLVFGLINLLIYVPKYGKFNEPFPFMHILEIKEVDNSGFIVQGTSDPITALQSDPYWSLWSFCLYGGMLILIFSIVPTRTIIRK